MLATGGNVNNKIRYSVYHKLTIILCQLNLKKAGKNNNKNSRNPLSELGQFVQWLLREVS